MRTCDKLATELTTNSRHESRHLIDRDCAIVENPFCGQLKRMHWDWLEGVTNVPSSELQYGSGVKFQRVTDTKHACLPRPRSINSAGPGPVGRDTVTLLSNYSFPLQKSYLDFQCKAKFDAY